MYIKHLFNLSILILFLFMSESSNAQDEFDIIRQYKKALVKSDSLLANGTIATINLKELLAITKKLDHKHPEGYILQAMSYFNEGNFNESDFLYNVAKLRLADWNRNNVGAFYNFSGDQKMQLEEGLFLYMSADIDNYKRVLELALNYYKDNDYLYISKNKKYHKAAIPEEYSAMLKEFDENRETVKQGLFETREDMRKKVEEYYLMLNLKE